MYTVINDNIFNQHIRDIKNYTTLFSRHELTNNVFLKRSVFHFLTFKQKITSKRISLFVCCGPKFMKAIFFVI